MKRIFLFTILLFTAATLKAQTVEGHWSATMNGPVAIIEFRPGAFDSNSWTDTTNFRLSDLGNTANNSFSSTRDAGTVVFYGKFANGKGNGTYVFTLSKSFADSVAASGVTTVNARDGFSFFRKGFPIAYMTFLKQSGFKGITAHSANAMCALKIDGPFINQFKAIGYSNIPPHILITFKVMHIDAAFISGFQQLGYAHISLNDLPALKNNHITPEYVAEMQKQGIKETRLREYFRMKQNSAQ
jgi:hypothetical protein